MQCRIATRSIKVFLFCELRDYLFEHRWLDLSEKFDSLSSNSYHPCVFSTLAFDDSCFWKGIDGEAVVFEFLVSQSVVFELDFILKRLVFEVDLMVNACFWSWLECDFLCVAWRLNGGFENDLTVKQLFWIWPGREAVVLKFELTVKCNVSSTWSWNGCFRSCPNSGTVFELDVMLKSCFFLDGFDSKPFVYLNFSCWCNSCSRIWIVIETVILNVTRQWAFFFVIGMLVNQLLCISLVVKTVFFWLYFISPGMLLK
jgi:hypothetical protein